MINKCCFSKVHLPLLDEVIFTGSTQSKLMLNFELYNAINYYQINLRNYKL